MIREEKLTKVMDYIRKFTEENGYTPSVREIGKECGPCAEAQSARRGSRPPLKREVFAYLFTTVTKGNRFMPLRGSAVCPPRLAASLKKGGFCVSFHDSDQRERIHALARKRSLLHRSSRSGMAEERFLSIFINPRIWVEIALIVFLRVLLVYVHSTKDFILDIFQRSFRITRRVRQTRRVKRVLYGTRRHGALFAVCQKRRRVAKILRLRRNTFFWAEHFFVVHFFFSFPGLKTPEKQIADHFILHE